MLTTLELKNFRKHEDRAFTFAEGLVALRGVNEIGKSSALESIGYVLFGTKALRDSLENVVTWGKPVKDLRVRLTVQLNGRTLTFVRHKGGAEVIENDKVVVTGQTEVSAFAAEMLGGDLATCNKLLFANQGSLRGALNEGNKAVAELIETLADFDLFDRLVDLIQHKLVVGSPDVAQARLNQAVEQLATLTLPEPPTLNAKVPAIEAEIGAAKDALLQIEAKVADYRTYYDANVKAWMAHCEVEQGKVKLAADIVAAQAEVERLSNMPLPMRVELAPLQQRLKNAEAAAEILAARALYANYKGPADIWEGDEASLNEAIDKAYAVQNDAKVTIAQANGEIQTRRAQIITSLTCPTCGSALKDAENIARRNEEQEREIQRLQDYIEFTKKMVAESTAHLPTLLAVRKSHVDTLALLGRTQPYVQAGTGTVPPSLTWVGPETISGEKVEEVKKLIAAAEAIEHNYVKHTGALEVAKERLTTLESKVFVDAPLPEGWTERNSAHADNLIAEGKAKGRLAELETELRIAKAEAAQAEAEWRAKKDQHDALTKEIAERRADIEALTFNNTLLKKVRAARPQVADKLWNTVLATVSQMFSTMRGEPSKVEKGKDGFTVNGAPVSSLSGSTLDLLALAIRTALTRTFIPQASFMLLDEVTAACDSERSVSMLGFLASAGFKQIVMVSHEDVVDGVADVVIQL